MPIIIVPSGELERERVWKEGMDPLHWTPFLMDLFRIQDMMLLLQGEASLEKLARFRRGA